jgi:serine/threonine-protein kinase
MSGAMVEAEGASTRLAPGTIVAGRFRIVRVRGEGGMGAVYEAVDTVIERNVAVKLITSPNRQTAARFRQEAQAASRVSSRHVSAIHDFGEDPEHGLYMVMELLSGHTLDEVLAKEGALTPSQAASIGADIADALAAAHAAGVVHRDLKPGNVWILDEGGVKVIDFGIARIAEVEPARTSKPSLTAPDTIMGTPLYMSPEAAKGEEVGPPTDLYALGVMLFEMVTGQPPFWDEVPVLILTQQIEAPPPTLASIRPEVALPEGFEGLVGALLEKDPERRPRSAREVRDMLSAMSDEDGPVRLAGDPNAAGAATAVVRRPSTIRRTPTLGMASVGTAVIAALAIFGLAAWFTLGRGETDAPAVPSAPPAPEIELPPGIEPPPEAPPADVRVEIATTPASAELLLDGAPTQSPLTLPRDGSEHVLTFHARGYVDETRTIRSDSDLRLEIVMRRRPPRPRGGGLPAKLREW